MAIIKSFSPLQNLSNYGTFVVDTNPNSDYFRITEFNETFTGGKNGFLIEGSEFLKETTEIKIEILDVAGNPVYYEPGDGIPEYYEGVSKLVSVHVYEDTPIGLGKITILGELKTYVDDNGVIRDIPNEWRGSYNLKWEKTFNINKNLNNETIVRFYKRPQVTIDEIVKPIFSKTIPSITQSGSVIGISQTPTAGTNLSNWTAGTFYKLKINDDSNWTSSVDENIINIPSLGYSPLVREVLNNKEVIVDIPFASNNIVSDFTASEYSTTFEYLEGQSIGESALTGSFAKINIKQLKTFVGDVARVKVYRKSRNDVGDFQFVQESKLESTELLRDITTAVDTEISYGNFTDYNLETYWTASNPVHPISLDVQFLNAAVKVDYDTTAGGVQQLITTEEFTISKDVEYTLSFKTLLSGSVDTNKTLKAYLSSSDYQQTFLTIDGSAIYQARQNVSQNIIATADATAKVVFEYVGDDWYTSNISLKNAQETSFSPDEFILIQEIPRNLPQETFDFRFEFYDINNNYIPVDVTATKIFTGGNNFPTSGKLLSFGTDRTVFRFSSGSIQNPPNQQIKFTVSQINLTGSVTFESSAFDTQGNYLNPSDYIVYPGQLTSVNPAGAILTINNFTGSRADGNETPYVGSIIFTASMDGLSEFETVYRLEDGENAPGLFVTSDTNQFIYKATDLSPNPVNQTIIFLVKRKNLASTTTPIIINSGSVPPLNFLDTDTGTGVSSYSLSIGNFAYNKNSPSASYYFTASDEFGNEQYDSVTISQVKILDGLSATLTNDNTSLPALSTGFVASGSFVFTSGSINVKVGNETILFDDDNDGLRANNTFAITNLSGIGCIPNGGNNSNPAINSYGITSLSQDSGSLNITVDYIDGAGDATSLIKTVTYTKNKKAAPVLNFIIGNNNQTVTAKSTGEQIDSFVNASFTVNETYNGITSTKTFTPTSITTTNLYVTGSTTSTSMTLPNMANGTDSTDIAITGSVIDSENTTRLVYGNISLAKSKKAVPNVTISATPQAQSVLANSTGVQTGTLSNVTITALEGNISRFTSMVIISTTGFSTPPTVSGNSLVMTSAIMNAAEASVTLTVTHTDSEGSAGQTQTIIVRTTKVNVGAPGAPGAPGADGRRTATGMVFYQPTSTTSPATPTAASYTFSTNTFSSLTTNWGVGAPTYEAGNSNKYWYSTYTVVETVAGGGTGVPTFTAPIQAINFTGLVTFTSTNKITDGINILENIPSGSITNHIGGPGVTTIDGGKISTGLITSTGYATTNPDDGLYTLAGTIFNLNNGSLRSKNFYIDSSGNAVFRGSITAEGGTIGGITIAPTKLYIGVGTYANTNTAFYVDNTGKFSLKDKLYWDGTNLNVTGTIKVATGEEVVASTITNAASALQNGQTGKSLGLTGGSVGGVTIAPSKIYIGVGNYANADTGFYVDSSGNFSLKDKLTWNGTTLSINGNGTFSGALSAATGTFNGSVKIGSGTSVFTADTNGIYLGSEIFGSAPFRVTPAGALTATSGDIAGWVIEPSGLSKTSGNYLLKLDSSNQKISIAKKASSPTVTEIYDVVVLSPQENIPPINTDGISIGALDWDTNNAVVQTYNYQDINVSYDTGFESPDGANQTPIGVLGVVGLVYASEEIYIDPDILFPESPVDNVIQVNTVGQYYANWQLILRVRKFPTIADANAGTNADVTFGDRQVLAAERVIGRDSFFNIIDEKLAYGATIPAAGGGGVETPGDPVIYRVELKQIWTVQITGGDSNDFVTFRRPGGNDVRVLYNRVNNGYSVLSPGGLQVYQGLKNYANFSKPTSTSGDASNFMLVKGKSQIVGSLNVSSGFSAANKQFKIQHPVDDNKWLYHTSIEAPRADLIYRGVIQLNNGSGMISIDSASNMMGGTYVALTKNQQLFLQNESGFDRVIGTVVNGVVSITSENPTSSDTISWMVIAERNDVEILQSPLYSGDGKYKPERYKREYIDQLFNTNMSGSTDFVN